MATNHQGMEMSQKKKADSMLNYMRKHWELYIIFVGPALLLTLIFKYVPMGGILIAFQKFNPIKGVVGSEWVGFKFFERFLSSPDFVQYLANTLKLSVYGLLWGFPVPIILALLLNRMQSKEKDSDLTLYAKLCLCHCTLWYGENSLICDRTNQSSLWLKY